MKDQIYLQLFLAVTMLASTLATTDELFSAIPTIPALLPQANPTPTYSPPKPNEAPVCQSINIQHLGYNATQKGGDIFLNPPVPKPTPTQPTNVVATTTSKVTTTTTTTTEVKTVTTTSKTTIEATTTSTNTTVPMDVNPCVVPEWSNGTQYNWWQILLELGGKPGTLKGNKNPEKPALDSPPYNPCDRPLESENPYEYLYEYVDSDLKTYYRKETGYPRFYGTPKYFVEVKGHLVWTPPEKANDKRGYSVLYDLDDVGFWVYVERKNCEFEEGTLSCMNIPDCRCENGKLECLYQIGVGANLLASLVGGG